MGEALENCAGWSDALTLVIKVIITELFSQWEMQWCSNDDLGPYYVLLLAYFTYRLCNRVPCSFSVSFPVILTVQGRKALPSVLLGFLCWSCIVFGLIIIFV